MAETQPIDPELLSILACPETHQPLAQADDALVTSVNDNMGIGAFASQVDDPNQPETSGRRFATDGIITTAPTVNVSAGTLAVPEPGQLLMLASGIALLLGLARRRRAGARGAKRSAR